MITYPVSIGLTKRWEGRRMGDRNALEPSFRYFSKPAME